MHYAIHCKTKLNRHDNDATVTATITPEGCSPRTYQFAQYVGWEEALSIAADLIGPVSAEAARCESLVGFSGLPDADTIRVAMEVVARDRAWRRAEVASTSTAIYCSQES